MQVWTIGLDCTLNLCPPVRISQRTARLAGKKWSSIYNEYKEDKAINMRSRSDRSEKYRWCQLVNEFVSDRTHVVSYAHANVTNPNGMKFTSASATTSMEHNASESTSKYPEPKRNDDIFLERYIGRIEESNKAIMNTLKASDDMKMSILMSMQQTMQKLVDKP